MRASSFGQQIRREAHADLDGVIDEAADAVAPTLERIRIQQHGMRSERDLRELTGSLLAMVQQNYPDMPDKTQAAIAAAMDSMIDPGLEAARREGKQLVDQPDPLAPGGVPGAAAAAMDGRGKTA